MKILFLPGLGCHIGPSEACLATPVADSWLPLRHLSSPTERWEAIIADRVTVTITMVTAARTVFPGTVLY